MGAYRSFFSARFRTLLQYRAAAFGGLVTQIFFGIFILAAYEAYYRSSGRPQPMSIGEVRSYIWLGQAMLAMLPWNVEAELRLMIRTGAVAYELLRPVSLYGLWFARTLAFRTAPTLLRAVPLYLFALAFLGLRLPASPAAAGAWALSTAAALVLGCALTTLLTVSLLWTISGEGINYLVYSLVILLSGMNIPIPLLPDWLRPIVEVLPFRGLIDTPFRLYIGNLPASSVFPGLLHQLGWAAALIGIGLAAMRAGIRRIAIHGG